MFIQKEREWKVLPKYKLWKGPSTQQGIITQYRCRALADDGFVLWEGWFTDREEFDFFLASIADGSILFDRSLWYTPSPNWNPELGRNLSIRYDFATVVAITAGTSYNNPNDSIGPSGGSGEFIDCIGAGANAPAAKGGSIQIILGGGGGAWSRITTLALTPGNSYTIQLGVGGAQIVNTSANTLVNGNDGTDTWFNGASLAAASVGAKAGTKGTTSSSGSGAVSPSNGGLASGRPNTANTTGNNGGSGGTYHGGFASSISTGGGGAAGPDGGGTSGTTSSGTSQGTAGGNSNSGLDASGSAGSTTGNGSTSNGGDGTKYGSVGLGAGSGAMFLGSAGTATSGRGGDYGGGVGGVKTISGTATAGRGGNGLIVFAYNPISLGALIARKRYALIGGGLVQ